MVVYEKIHINSIFWSLKGKATPIVSYVKDGKKGYFSINRGDKIEIVKEYGRFCTGYFKEKRHYPCPTKSKIEYGTKCKECALKDEYLKCAKCNGSTCNASKTIRENCLNSTYFLYITLIGSMLKVGITKSNRYLRRWIEQGSDYSALIGSGNGMEIRKREYKIAKKIVDRIKTKEKISMLFEDKKEILEKFLEDNGFNAKIIEVRKYYEGLSLVPREITATNRLKGRIVAIKGKLIIFEDNEKYYVFDTNNLVGKVVDLMLEKEK